MSKLEEIKEALGRTTPGPWQTQRVPTYGRFSHEPCMGDDLDVGFGDEPTEDDVLFVALAHNDYVPWLLAEVERLNSMIAGEGS